METRNFRQLLQNEWRRDRMICVGLDPDWERIPPSLKTQGGRERAPAEVLYDFCRRIIDATCEVAGTYKPQAAYFEKWGGPGYGVLQQIVEYLDQVAPDVPRILDAKRGDGIDRSNRAYAEAIFGHQGFDAVTLHPYFSGAQALRPFLDHPEKGLIILCRSSGSGAGEFQDLLVALQQDELQDLLSGPARSCTDEAALFGRASNGHHLTPLSLVVALRVANHWNKQGNCGLVVGATYPKEAREIRRLVGDEVYFLVPGAGAQGGDVEASVKACRNSRNEGFILSSSSGIIHASQQSDFAERAREKATELNEAINRYRQE
jgi:orotidine-5'-phosphate decarboxylase